MARGSEANVTYGEKTGPKALRTPTAIREENPDAHNIPPLRRASGYGNTRRNHLAKRGCSEKGRPARHSFILPVFTLVSKLKVREPWELNLLTTKP